jgi:acyl-CoA synthetase (AMP-forming)/AMP-acid ligase II
VRLHLAGVPHRALVNYVQWANSVYLNGEVPTFALHSSLSFDLTVTSIFTPLTTGGMVVAYPSRGGEPPILDVLRDNRVNIVKLTPSHLALVAAQGIAHSRLRTFIVGGENLETALARRVHDQFGGRIAIFNEYGPTELVAEYMEATAPGSYVALSHARSDGQRDAAGFAKAAGFNFDCSHMEWQGVSGVDFIRAYGDHIHCAHIKGVQVVKGYTRNGRLGGHKPMGDKHNGWNFVTASTGPVKMLRTSLPRLVWCSVGNISPPLSIHPSHV